MSRPPSNCVESLAAVLRPLTGGHADDIVGCEWWVHSKVANLAASPPSVTFHDLP